MKHSFIGLIFVLISFTNLRLSESLLDERSSLPIIAIAKCGYNCWPKYGIDTDKDLDINTNLMQMSHKHLDDYQIGELRGCMEECLIRDTQSEYYPSVDQSFGPNN